jgi:HSP20 family protein
MARRTADSFTDFEKLINDRMERAYQKVFGSPPGSNFCAPYMEPPVDVYQTDSHVVVVMEIAGIAGEEIELHVDRSTMVIRGERREQAAPRNRSYSQMEIAHGPFQREIMLPAPVNPDESQAVYKDGILQITLPKTATVMGTQLRIVVSG